ncbi:hypothetical protein [Bradyrhizobium sp. S69]|uniref:hypothetical protein n=1 Tax=Bradyrhizobium sp. S69 TaxID=1641856 RepID=UPI00131D168F|nr:hypothetical protein [Bradyrhizobium sp. S69]
MSKVRGRPWTSQDDLLLRNLTAAGKNAFTIAVEMNRSESVIRRRAKESDLKIAKNTERTNSRVDLGLKAKR